MNLPVTIYGLADPRSPDAIRYVGKTSLPLHIRVQQHWSSSIRSDSPRALWVRGLRDSGLRPIIRELEACTTENWQEREIFWISHFKPSGLLQNQTCGGLFGGGWKHDPKTIAFYKESRRGIQPSALNRTLTAPKLEIANKRAAKKVRCIETGEIFDSIAEAARSLNKSPEHFRENIRLGYKTRGRTYEICQRQCL